MLLPGRENLTIEEIKREIFADLQAFHPEARPEYSPYDQAYKEVMKSYYKFPASGSVVSSYDAFKHP